MNQRQFDRRPSKPTANPRRVVGGFKLTAKKPGEAPWVIQRWMRLVETYAPGEQLSEGLEYGRLGQTRGFEIAAGFVSARVQGRMPKAYNVAIRMPTFSSDHWAPVIDAMLVQARYAATLLSGEVPPNIEDLFVPAGLRLFPSEPSDLAVSCTCSIFTGKPIEVEHTYTYNAALGHSVPIVRPEVAAPEAIAPEALSPEDAPFAATSSALPASADAADATAPALSDVDPIDPADPAAAAALALPLNPVLPPGVPWCKHACCVMALVADKLAADPFLIFALRGMPPDELLERLRQRRQATGSNRTPGTSSLVYEPHLAGVSDRSNKALEESIESFWTAPDSLRQIDLPIEPPEVSHPLLRRMGPSPFPKAKFPIVGLLATVYDLISRDAIGEGPVIGDDASGDVSQ